MIDLRSDTVTRPTAAMRKAMAEAEVGDDVYREDPTVNRLEARAAELLGKEAALFVPSGTMGNTIGLKVLTEHGQEVICDAHAHILDWELSMTAWFSGCLVRSLPTTDGVLRWAELKNYVRRAGPHNAGTAVIEVENTHNMAGGTVYPLDVLRELCGEAHDAGIRVHMDGARIFNAAAASGIRAHEIARYADTVMFCLSKGLGAPVGSMLAGTEEAMSRARLYRKRLGGGMRQAGVLAAAGLIALNEMTDRLADDHANARLLANALAQIPGLSVTPPQTNIIMIHVTAAAGVLAPEISRRLKLDGVLMNSVNDTLLRAVTHFDVTAADCGRAAEALAGVLMRTSAHAH
jgi:threonine aldolase